MKLRRSALIPHLGAVAIYAALACVISWPLATHLFTHLPGGGIGDNVQFLWNFWWMRTALASGADFFQTPYLFAPLGADIALHTHTALPAFLGATILAGVPLVAAHNVLVLASLALNGFCAYLVAWKAPRVSGAALVCGIVFGASPYVAAHLNGHFNLTAAWTIPLFVLALQASGVGPTASSVERAASRSMSLGSSRGPGAALRLALAPGIVLGMTAYVDYYYVVYQLALAVVAWAWTAYAWSWGVRGSTPASRRWAYFFAALAAIDVVLLMAIGATGGFRVELGSLTISARSAFNPLQALWILLALVIEAYDADPLIGALLRASPPDSDAAAAGLPDRDTAARLLESHGIRFVMLNRETAPRGLTRYVEEVLPLRRIAAEGERTLYLVEPAQ